MFQHLYLLLLRRLGPSLHVFPPTNPHLAQQYPRPFLPYVHAQQSMLISFSTCAASVPIFCKNEQLDKAAGPKTCHRIRTHTGLHIHTPHRRQVLTGGIWNSTPSEIRRSFMGETSKRPTANPPRPIVNTRTSSRSRLVWAKGFHSSHRVF